MAAGQGAAEQARIATERAAQLRHQAEQAERAAKSWAAGAAGERLVAARLQELEALGWRLLNDAHWPGRAKANLDHVLVGPGGILVVDAKNWSGRVELRNGRLTQNGYSRSRETAGVLEQGSAVAAVLEPRYRTLVQGWICLVNQPELPTQSADGARIVGLGSLHDAVVVLPQVLESAEIDHVFNSLSQLLHGPRSPELLSTVDAPVLPTSEQATTEAAEPAASPETRRPKGSRGSGRRRQQHPQAGAARRRRSKESGRRRQSSRSRRSEILRLIVLAVIAVTAWNISGSLSQRSAAVPTPPQPPSVNSQTSELSP